MPGSPSSQRRKIRAQAIAFDRPHVRMQACAAVFAFSPIVNTPTPKSPDDENAAVPDFERSLAELEAIVEKLERGELSLEESLQQFERGVRLTRACQAALKEAEQKVEILLRKSGGSDSFETAAFDPDESEED